MEMNFCRRCGTRLSHIKDHVYKCEAGHTLFANSSPAVGIFFVTPDDEVLFSVRGIEPHKGMLDAFGGFVDDEETFEDAIARELKEELNLNPSDYENVTYLCSGVGHYPYGGETIPVLSSLFWSRLTNTSNLTPQDDVAAIKKIKLNEVDFDQLHDEDIRIGIRQLQSILE